MVRLWAGGHWSLKRQDAAKTMRAMHNGAVLLEHIMSRRLARLCRNGSVGIARLRCGKSVRSGDYRVRPPPIITDFQPTSQPSQPLTINPPLLCPLHNTTHTHHHGTATPQRSQHPPHARPVRPVVRHFPHHVRAAEQGPAQLAQRVPGSAARRRRRQDRH